MRRTETRQQWHRSEKGKAYIKARNRRMLLKKYGLTPEQYDEAFHKQDGKCLICGRQSGIGRHRLHVDHDHISGNVRGLICFKCNSGLGMFQDSVSVLRKAVEYLENSRGKM